MKSGCIALAVALTVAACSSSERGHSQAQEVGATANAPSAAIAAATANDDPPAPNGALPIYPGAEKLKLPPGMPPLEVNKCGSKMRVVDYKAGVVDPAAIANWYAAHIPGGIRVAGTFASGSFDSVYAPDGSAIATAIRMSDRATTLGIVTYQPPLSHDMLQLIVRYANGDEAAKKSAREELKAKCPGYEPQ